MCDVQLRKCKSSDRDCCSKFQAKHGYIKSNFHRRDKGGQKSSSLKLSFWQKPAEKAELRMALLQGSILLRLKGPGVDCDRARH